ncbi:MAG: hypothetical protein ACYDFU_03710 [Nitrospirota bacterium]
MNNKTFVLRILLVLSLATIFYCLYLYLNPYTFRITGGYLYKIDRVSGQVWRQEQGSTSNDFEIISEGTNRVPIILSTSTIVFFACVLLMAFEHEKARSLREKYLSKRKVITALIAIGIVWFAYGLFVFASLKPGDRFKILGIRVYEKPYPSLNEIFGTSKASSRPSLDEIFGGQPSQAPTATRHTKKDIFDTLTYRPVKQKKTVKLIPIDYDPFSSLDAYKQKLTEGMPNAVEILNSSEFQQWLHDNSKWDEVKQADDAHNYGVVLKALKEFKENESRGNFDR